MVTLNNNLDYTTPSALEWNDLSMKDKAAFIRLAVAAGYKNIDDIRQLYEELNDVNLFEGGGNKERHRFTPSKAVRDRISKWEGNAMVKDTVDPLSGKLVKRNNSFENEAAAFVNAIPPALRRTVLSNQDLADHLYSYSYNVGAGRFKERVVPKLIDYYNGKATIDDVTNSMWAAGDTKLKGLRLRREVEKEGVRNALQNMINPYTTSSVVELPVDAVRISMPVDIVTPYTAPKVIDASIFNLPLRLYFKYTPEYLINQAGKIIIPESSISTTVPLTATEILKLLELLKQQLRKTLLDLELEDSLYADGGNLFEDGGDTDYVANYDDTYGAKYGILPEVVVTPNNTPNIIKPKLDEKQWQKYWGDEGAASVSRGMNDAAPYVMEGMSMLVGNPIGATAGIVGSRLGEEIGDFVAGPIGRTIGGVAGGLLLGATDGFINGRNIKNLTSAERKIAENSGKLNIKNLFDTPEHRGVSNLVISDPNDVNFVLKKSSKGYTLEELDNIIKNNETLNKYSFILPHEHVETITGEDGLLYPIWKQLKIETYGREAPFGTDHKLLLGEALETLRAKSNAIVNAIRLLALNQGLLLLDGRILTSDGLIKDFGEFHNVGITPNGKPVIFDGLLDTSSKLINITPENASSITPEQWTATQDAAIARGDIAEVQRLRDLHFEANAPNTKTDVPLWSSSEEAFNSFDLSHFGETDSGFFGYGHYLTPIEKYAATYHPVNRKFYANIENPYIGNNDQYFNRIQYVKDRLAMRKENVMRNLRDGKLTKFSKKLGINENTSLEDAERLIDKYIADETVKWNDKYVRYVDEFDGKDGILSWRELQGVPNNQEGIYREVVVPRGEQIKSADAITYDDNGVRIPLGLRDNFNINDIRYGIAPFLLGGIGAGLYKEKGNNYRNIR